MAYEGCMTELQMVVVLGQCLWMKVIYYIFGHWQLLQRTFLYFHSEEQICFRDSSFSYWVSSVTQLHLSFELWTRGNLVFSMHLYTHTVWFVLVRNKIKVKIFCPHLLDCVYWNWIQGEDCLLLVYIYGSTTPNSPSDCWCYIKKCKMPYILFFFIALLSLLCKWKWDHYYYYYYYYNYYFFNIICSFSTGRHGLHIFVYLQKSLFRHHTINSPTGYNDHH